MAIRLIVFSTQLHILRKIISCATLKMSAQDQMRAMLDELMGTARDGDASRCQMKFDDPRVCKSFLLSCCPHDILSSTRMDLGDCPKYHDVALRADYEAASKKKDYFYDIDAMEHLQNFINECDRKTEMYKRRLKETQEELSEEANSKAESIHNLGEEIGTKLAKAEGLGAEGKVEESIDLMNEVEELKKQKVMAENLGEEIGTKLAKAEGLGAEGIVEESIDLMNEVKELKKQKVMAEQEYKNSMPASSYQQQKLRVCEICSAYLGIHDNDRRLADHFGGKLHLGFITIRDKLTELKSTHADRIKQRGEEREKLRKQREEERQRDDDRRSTSRRRSRSRSRSRERRRRSRSRSRRSRSGERRSHKKSRRRSRSRSRRSRSRSRKRSRRSRSRSRSRRSRSRSRKKKSHRRNRSRSDSRSKSRRSASIENGAPMEMPVVGDT